MNFVAIIHEALLAEREWLEQVGRLPVSSGPETQANTAQTIDVNDAGNPRFEAGEYDLRVAQTAGESACRLFDQDSV